VVFWRGEREYLMMGLVWSRFSLLLLQNITEYKKEKLWEMEAVVSRLRQCRKFVVGRQRLENYHYNMYPSIFHPFFIYIYSPFSK
jgi:hypothetical protein